MSPLTWLLIGVGGGLGAGGRFVLTWWLADHATPGWHRGTLLANLIASAGLGLLSGAEVVGGWTALLGAGLCGGLSTWSSFAVQVVSAPPRRAVGYVALTLLGSLVACLAGFGIGRLL